MEVPALAEYLSKYSSDRAWQAAMEERQSARAESIARQAPFIQGFVEGRLSVADFRRQMESESANHNLWGFSGFAGQMYLNMLVKNSADPEHLARAMRAGISSPPDLPSAIAKITEFATFVLDENSRIQPASKRPAVGFTLYFLTYFWNIQQPGLLPIYFPTAVEALEQIRAVDLSEIEDLAQRYETYHSWMEKVRRDCREAFGKDSFTYAENFLLFVTRQSAEPDRQPKSHSSVPSGDLPEPDATLPDEDGSHTEIQGMLAKIGKLRGYKVHVANNDKNRVWNGTTLGVVGGDELPLPGYEPEDRRIIDLIDVVWFKGKDIIHLFEVERSTNVYGGLLRMSDLLSLHPSLRPGLTIVAPQDREREARRIMARPTFRRMKEEADRQFEFKSFESVRRQYNAELNNEIIH